MASFSKTVLLLMLLGFSFFGLSSYSHYTSVGVDRDQYNNDHIRHSYYRVRWPGNGSFWLGGGTSNRPLNSSKPFEGFDLAATFLDSNPVLPVAESNYNKVGFWLRSMTHPSKQFWLGIPSWLPVLFLGLLFFLSRKKQ